MSLFPYVTSALQAGLAIQHVVWYTKRTANRRTYRAMESDRKERESERDHNKPAQYKANSKFYLRLLLIVPVCSLAKVFYKPYSQMPIMKANRCSNLICLIHQKRIELEKLYI